MKKTTVKEVVMKHMSDNNLFMDCQYGFREKRSCVLQLIEVLINACDKSCQSDIIYLDIKKAFDTVPHRRLLLKLKAYSIEGEVL